MFVVTVTFVAKADCDGLFKKAMNNQSKNSLEQETDCIQFDVCMDSSNPHRIFLYEIYSDEAAFKAHLESGHFKEFSDQTAAWVESKDVQTWKLDRG